MSSVNSEQLLLGIDGGGSTCRARLADASGTILSEAQGGAANLRLGVAHVIEVIQDTTQKALHQAGLSHLPLNQLHAGIGLAGYVLSSDIQAALPIKQLFASCTLSNDAYIACLGAHQGQAGGIIIAGTGTCAQIICPAASRTFGGWGFALGDQGSGAILGREAVRLALQALEGLTQGSALTEQVNAYFEHKAERYLEWGLNAKPADYAIFARLVIEQADQGDSLALHLLDQALSSILLMFKVLKQYNTGRISLMGGLAPSYRRYLPQDIQQELMAVQGDALDGALLLARQIRPEQGVLCK
ncbi:BadF/BadG/BcrA/BcrD ATPase family protein [Thiolinea disciformis]|uniref:BadF/BadG/BcrA/BcrD ATPase family protein n=1 Tax=Thiolinea disciformis TaxID=125614 RepID=UPI0003731182|nr:BadF/BadG/BcrA/BcrD ATPase family protein [Thiolinea disciformis]